MSDLRREGYNQPCHCPYCVCTDVTRIQYNEAQASGTGWPEGIAIVPDLWVCPSCYHGDHKEKPSDDD